MKTFFYASVFVLVSYFAAADTLIPHPEPLKGFVTSFSGVRIQVESGGCTYKSSFRVKKEKMGDVTSLTFVRVDTDPCLALYYYGVELDYTYQELGLTPEEKFFVRNPLTYSIAR